MRLMLLFCILGIGQSLLMSQTLEPLFITKLFFEDAVGNRDTVEYGYDPRVLRRRTNPRTEWVYPSEAFGQERINTPFDSVFEVRIQSSHDLFGPINDVWYKRVIAPIDRYNQQFDCSIVLGGGFVAISAKHMPITISWNRNHYLSSWCRIGSTLESHNWVSRYEGQGGIGVPWYEWLPEYLDSTRCMAIDSTWTVTLRTGSDFAIRQIVSSGWNGTLDTLYSLQWGVVHQGEWNSPCDVQYVSTQEQVITKVQLLPNPASTVVRFSDNQSRRLIVLDALGRRVHDGFSSEIDVSGLSAGMYFAIGEGWRQIFFVNR